MASYTCRFFHWYEKAMHPRLHAWHLLIMVPAMDDIFPHDEIDYGSLIDEAMQVIVKRALELVVREGLPSEHHFYISFQTRHKGVMLSKELKEKYPDEMTIVVQYQYWDLVVEDDKFHITLSFNNIKYPMSIPFDAITSFADPSVKFGLQFQESDDVLPMEDMFDNVSQDGMSGDGESLGEKKYVDNVITLDSFRKEKPDD